MQKASSALVIYAGLAGAAGVALAAAGAHGNGLESLTPAAQILLIHAAAAIAIVAVAGSAVRSGAFLIAGLILVLGASLFSGDIASRAFLGDRLFPMAAPTGGTTMIVGWLVVAGVGLWELLSRRG